MIKTTIKTLVESCLSTTVDTVQTAKKIAVDTFVKHEGLSQTLTDFVDAQTEYTKKAIDTGMKTGTNVYNVITTKAFYTDTAKAVQESVSAFINTQKKEK